MSYASQANTTRPAALMGALAVPLGFGALLATGLAITATIAVPDKPLTGVLIKPKPIETPLPPPKPVDPKTTPNPADKVVQTANVVIPKPDVPFTTGPQIPVDIFDGTIIDVIEFPLPTGPGKGTSGPTPSPMADPIGALPRGNPGSWVTTGDYRTRWINEGLSGTARFTLKIDASGKVSDCAITQSTGHDVLDGATCRLLERRARFAPARNGKGEKVAGTYSSAINWEIP